jgi:Ca-activated chloride channel family protein
LALIPLLVAAVIWMQRRRRKYAVRFSSLSLVRAAIPRQSWVRRYLPMLLFFLALASLAVGFARPIAVTLIPAGRATIILALDVSGSMRQTDIFPSRLGAAKEAALSFIERQQEHNQIGIVAFAGISQLVQPPSNEQQDLRSAILHLTTGRGTAIGSGILTALDTIDEFGQNSLIGQNSDQTSQATPRAEGQYEPDIIVLLTDGVYTTGPNPLDAAQEAVARGVRVYTIGFGTLAGQVQQDGDFFGRRFNRGIDEASLKEIAAMTGGEYYAASSASELQKVFDSLPTVLITREETTEISVAFAALAALLVTSAVLLALLWHPLP